MLLSRLNGQDKQRGGDSRLGGIDLADIRLGQQPVFDEAAAAERHLPRVCRHPHDDRVAKDATQRPGIPGNGPARNREAIRVKLFVIHT
jgi:hypothetical protein